MTHWSDITRTTREFTDSSYKKLHTPSEYFWTKQQKAEMKRKEDEKARRHRDMEESRRSPTL